MMDWLEFRDRLCATLAQVTDRCFLIISAPGRGGYVQFAGSEDYVSAEAAGPSFVDGPGAHTVSNAAMGAVGWAAPSQSQPNWSQSLELPALTAEIAGLADGCVVALRDVFGVVEPGLLTYRAWREPEVQPPGVTWSAERFDALDPGEDPLLLPALGLAVDATA
jgi:hypothetical protein